MSVGLYTTDVPVHGYTASVKRAVTVRETSAAALRTMRLLNTDVSHLSPMPSPLSSSVGMACWGFSCNRMRSVSLKASIH
jgi:hypothetical protein